MDELDYYCMKYDYKVEKQERLYEAFKREVEPYLLEIDIQIKAILDIAEDYYDFDFKDEAIELIKERI